RDRARKEPLIETAMTDVLFVMIRGGVPQPYGGEMSSMATAQAIRPMGFRPDFIVTDDDDLARELDARGLPFHLVPVQDPLADVRGAGWRQRLKKVGDVVRLNSVIWRRASRGAVVHTSTLGGFFCAYFGAKLAGARVLYHVRGPDRRKRRLQTLAVLLADRT